MKVEMRNNSVLVEGDEYYYKEVVSLIFTNNQCAN